MVDLESLIGAVEEAPDDEGRWVVLRDALLEQGDVQGELLALQLRDETQHALPSWFRPTTVGISELLKAHRTELLGRLVHYPDASLVSLALTWRRGFIGAARVDAERLGDSALTILELLLRLRAARLIDVLRIQTRAGRLSAEDVQLRLERLPGRARRLELSSHEAFSVRRVLAAWPKLLELTLHAPFLIEEFDASRLEALRLSGSESDVALLLGENALPALRALGVWSPNPRGGSQWPDLWPLMRRDHFPRLTELEVFGDVRATVAGLSQTPVAKRLTALKLRDVFTLETIDHLVSERSRFPQLTHLTLDGYYERPAFPRAERKRLHRRFPGLKLTVDLR